MSEEQIDELLKELSSLRKGAEVERYKALAKKLSDALLTVRPLGGSELFMRVGEEFYADPVVCEAEIQRLRDDLHKARAETVLLRRRAALVSGSREDGDG